MKYLPLLSNLQKNENRVQSTQFAVNVKHKLGILLESWAKWVGLFVYRQKKSLIISVKPKVSIAKTNT